MLLEIHTNISCNLRKDGVWVWVETGDWRPQGDFCRMRSEHLKRSEPPCKLVWLSLKSKNDITMDWKGAEKLAISKKQDYQQSAAKTIAEDWAEMSRTILRKYYKMSVSMFYCILRENINILTRRYFSKRTGCIRLNFGIRGLRSKTNFFTTLIDSMNLASQKILNLVFGILQVSFLAFRQQWCLVCVASFLGSYDCDGVLENSETLRQHSKNVFL